MKKRIYEQPKVKVVEIESTTILVGSNERLRDGGDIFGTRGLDGDFGEE